MQRYFAKGIYNDKIVLLDSDIHHIKNVMRMQIGVKIDVVYANKLYICSIEKFDPFSLKIEAHYSPPPASFSSEYTRTTAATCSKSR